MEDMKVQLSSAQDRIAAAPNPVSQRPTLKAWPATNHVTAGPSTLILHRSNYGPLLGSDVSNWPLWRASETSARGLLRGCDSWGRPKISWIIIVPIHNHSHGHLGISPIFWAKPLKASACFCLLKKSKSFEDRFSTCPNSANFVRIPPWCRRGKVWCTSHGCHVLPRWRKTFSSTLHYEWLIIYAYVTLSLTVMYGYVYRLVQASIEAQPVISKSKVESNWCCIPSFSWRSPWFCSCECPGLSSFQQDRLLCPREAALWRAVSYSIGNIQLLINSLWAVLKVHHIRITRSHTMLTRTWILHQTNEVSSDTPKSSKSWSHFRIETAMLLGSFRDPRF